VAAVAPLALGFVAVVITGALIYFLSYGYSMSLYVTNMASMIGIGVAVDYSLFIVSRFRIELQRGADKLEALAIALKTSGNAVLFSGATVVVSLAGLFLLQMNAMRSMAVGAILVVAVAVIASLTLLPAFLSTVGHNIERLRVPTPWATGGEAGGDFWRNWTNGVLRRPVISLVVGAAIMLTLASPVLYMHVFTRGITLLPSDSPTRIATERVQRAVGPGGSGPAHVVTGSRAAATELRTRVARVQGVARTGPIVASPDKQVFLFEAYFKSDPESDAASATVARIERVAGSVAARNGTTAAVGGTAAQERSLKEAILHNLWKLILFILVASYLILLLLLRSVVLPLKAVLMNILSVAAAYGILVAVFQWGVLDWTGYKSPGYIDTIVPALVLAVTFGLSMDYEVFLLTRIKERWIALGDSDAAVSEGVMLCARIISSAALIMVAVFSAFSIAGSIELRELGVGLAAAVALDATIVRLVIVPSTMKLLGDWNWWLPGWLDRRLPQIGEAPRTSTPVPPLEEPEPALVVTGGPLVGKRLFFDSELVLGRGRADVVLEDEEVSRRHALIRHANGRLVLYDLGSLNGTWVNGDRIIDEPRTLTVGDSIQLGATTIAVTPPRPGLTITSGPLAGRRLRVDPQLILGRTDADVTLEDDEVSRHHALIRMDGDGLVVEDLGSLNGTWVNGVRIGTARVLHVGDTIRLGETAIEVTPES
jgi:RND superfamily putative drug exporter